METQKHTPGEATLAFVAKSDAMLNKKIGYAADSIKSELDRLLTHRVVEVGWRESCGTTDFTMHVYREWVKVVKRLEKEGLKIKQERIKHGNSYATNKGGFWNSIVYSLV
jgi:hypothetical protein